MKERATFSGGGAWLVALPAPAKPLGAASHPEAAPFFYLSGF